MRLTLTMQTTNGKVLALKTGVQFYLQGSEISAIRNLMGNDTVQAVLVKCPRQEIS